jgi:hypothetical protein
MIYLLKPIKRNKRCIVAWNVILIKRLLLLVARNSLLYNIGLLWGNGYLLQIILKDKLVLRRIVLTYKLRKLLNHVLLSLLLMVLLYNLISDIIGLALSLLGYYFRHKARGTQIYLLRIRVHQTELQVA